MEGGLVRSILGSHALHGREGAWPAAADPNALVDAAPLCDALQALDPRDGEAAVRALAHGYVALWARTFKTLVRHLRGRPERALALFASEVYPFLRGDRLAARVASAQPGRARLILAGGLPEPYLAGLAEGFVRLSAARAECRPVGGGIFEVAWRVAPADILARLSQNLASLRVPLLLSAALSALLGVALAARLAGTLEAWRVAATLLGAVAVQVAANALHDLRDPHPAGPLGPVRPSRAALRRLVRGGYALAGALGLALAVQAPIVLAFAAAGLAASTLFARFRSAGWGPLLAALTYGPLLPLGAMHAAAPALRLAPRVEILLTLPMGALAAAILYLDDLADRPIDEAGGKRTLLVRLPPRQRLVGYVALLGAGLAGVVASLLWLAPRGALAAAPLALLALALAEWVRRHADDPHGLTPARLGTLATHVLASALLIAAVLAGAP